MPLSATARTAAAIVLALLTTPVRAEEQAGRLMKLHPDRKSVV